MLVKCHNTVNVRTWINLLVYLSQTDNIYQGAVSNGLESNSFAASFMNLKLRRECKKDGRKEGGDRIIG